MISQSDWVDIEMNENNCRINILKKYMDTGTLEIADIYNILHLKQPEYCEPSNNVFVVHFFNDLLNELRKC